MIADSLIARLDRPALYRPNATFRNPRWEQASVRVLIVRLSPFEDVRRSFSHLFLAQETRRADAMAYLDFAFLPSRRDRRELERAGAPMCFGIQSRFAAAQYDLILVSCAFVNEIVNLPWLLLRSGVALTASERDAPVVILGGSAPLSPFADATGAAIPDAIFFGEGEHRVEAIVRAVAGAGRGSAKEALAKVADSIGGLWIAGDPGRRGTAAVCAEVDSELLTTDYPVLPGEEASTGRLQISYGCRYACAFCFEGNVRRPWREVPIEALLRTARELKRRAGATKLELSSYNFNSYVDIGELLLTMNESFAEVSAMSQRPDVLLRRTGLLELELAGEKRSFTIGVEGVSERQRRFLDKGVTEEDVLRLSERLFARGVREIKLFYVLTGYEDSDDFAEFDRFCAALREAVERAASRTKLLFSANRLVRMPSTPLAYDPPILERSRWDDLLGKFRDTATRNGIETRGSEPWNDYLAEQLLVTGAPAIAAAIVDCARNGLVYDGGMPEPAVKLLVAAGRGGVTPALPLAPDPLDREPGSDRLRRRYDRLLEEKAAGTRRRKTSNDDAGEPILRRGPDTVDPGLPARLDRVVRERKRLRPRHFLFDFPVEVAGMGSEWLASYLVRELIRACPGVADSLLSCREALWLPLWGEAVSWYGMSVVTVVAREGDNPLFDALGSTTVLKGEIDAFESSGLSLARILFQLPLEVCENPENVVSRFLATTYSPATVRKGESGWYLLDCPPRARKAKVVTGGRYRRSEEMFVAEFEIGRRFDAAAFVRAFGGDVKEREALYRSTIEVSHLEPWGDQS